MKIKTLYEDAVDRVEYGILTEAVRFGTKQKEVLERHEKDFKIGVEYEFHLRRDVVGAISSSPEDYMNEATEQMEEIFKNEIVEAAAPLALIIDTLAIAAPTADDVGEMIQDAEDGDFDMLETAIDSFTDPLFVNAIREAMSDRILNEAFPMAISELRHLQSLLPSMSQGYDNAVIAFRNLHIPNLYRLVDAADDDTLPQIQHNLRFLVTSDKEYANVNWYRSTLTLRARRKAEELADIPNLGFEEEYIAWVEKNINPSMRALIREITEDLTVPEGVEVISRPLSLRDTFILMKYMFNFISEYGHTSNRTGMHVNISMRNFGEIDPLQVMTLMDSDFFQGHTMKHQGSNRDIIKWEVRNDMVQRNSAKLLPEALRNIADAYVDGGIEAAENAMRGYMTGGLNPKHRAINWGHFLKNYDASQRRIEFRFFGGEGYEDRFLEIASDIMYLCYVILAASNKTHTKEHHKGMMRILDRATKTHFGMTFSQLINQRRKV